MSANQILQSLWETIDQECANISQSDYLEVLQGLVDDANLRIESVDVDDSTEISGSVDDDY